MQSPIERLPDDVLAKLVNNVLHSEPSTAPLFLASLGTRIHAISVATLFQQIHVHDDDASLALDHSSSARSNTFALLSNPARYGWAVKAVVVDAASETVQDDTHRPIGADDLSRLLRSCPNLQQFIWTSSMPPPDGLCEMLMDKPRLQKFSLNPSHHQVSPARHLLAKWDAPSLPCLAGLSSLEITRPLSQLGAHSLSTLLSSLASSLETLSLDFVWLDDSICEDIAALSRLRKLRLSTGGTKLTDQGIVTLMEGCDALQELILDDVEGRLSRCLWTKPLTYPKHLRTLQIIFSEAEHHHSWSADHLASIHEFPLASLTSLSVTRRQALPSPDGVYIKAHVDDAVALRPLPQDLLDKLATSASSMTHLDLDFWSCSISDVKTLVQKCQQLETLRLCLDAPFLKLLGLVSCFSLLSSLHTLSVAVLEEHAPGKAPLPLVPDHSTLFLKFEDDPSMPSAGRDIKKFVRKMSKLSLLEWYGKNGRGSWTAERSTTTSKLGPTVTVEYHPPSIDTEVWQTLQSRAGWTTDHHDGGAYRREGHAWTGDLADTTIARTELEHPCNQRTTHKPRAPSLSLSSSSSSADTTLNLLATPPPSALFSPPSFEQSKDTPPPSPPSDDDQLGDGPTIKRRSPGRPQRRRVTSETAGAATEASSGTPRSGRGPPKAASGGAPAKTGNGGGAASGGGRRDAPKAGNGRSRGGRRNSEKVGGETMPPPARSGRGGRRRMSAA
ncbi:hypothetical protein BD626DRAFT_563424 [Schizophyllum amplum]|uniref:F-box domain-containing protein n=1 Tax=Schizophyllum amplum TaxID=97359 RepID=A0A550CY54_9AGAR|nr:hypothetical protein BD626DRAFT_563424 [Auriculariopsis ampla]